jgi:hypothetical protein
VSSKSVLRGYPPVRMETFLILFILLKLFSNLLENFQLLKGIVSPDWKGLQMISLDRFEV